MVADEIWYINAKTQKRIDFYISCAGVAGDPNKLLYGEDVETGRRYFQMFNSNSIWALKRAKKKIIKKIKALEPEFINK